MRRRFCFLKKENLERDDMMGRGIEGIEIRENDQER